MLLHLPGEELLSQIGVEFEVKPADGEERIISTEPSKVVEELSGQKAMFTAKALEKENGHVPEGCIVLGADTIVSYEGRILGKPSDKEDAIQMLSMLQGNTHQVYTGVTVLKEKQGSWKFHTFFECTDVIFYPVTREEIVEYVNSGDPMDKAGSYGIQGAWGAYVKGIRGDYNNVVGLPVARLIYETKKIGINLKG